MHKAIQERSDPVYHWACHTMMRPALFLILSPMTVRCVCLLAMSAALLILIEPAQSTTVALDNAANSAYAEDPTGAWKGLNPTEGENPPGMDNGGFGFQPWDFRGGYHNPQQSPYGNLNHFIDGVDFSHRATNDLGSPAFGLTNAGTTPAAGFFGYTARATRVFNSPLSVGQTLSIDFDNPVPQPLDPFAPSGFLFRLNKGGGPVINNAPLPGVVERFGVATTANFHDGRWYTTDSEAFTDTTVAPDATASGATFRFTLTGVETYAMEFRRLSDNQQLFSRSGTLNNSGAGAIDTVEITLFSNGTSSTGLREFFFNNLRIEQDSNLLVGDYNHNGEVDTADYVIWRDTLGQSVPAGSGADGDNSGSIDPPDYDVWRSRFGNTPAAAAASHSVPEPPSTILATAIVVGLFPHVLSRRRI
jgi:hypothetical protein